MLYIDPLALHYYRKGHDPLDWGIGLTKWQTMKHDHDRGLPRDKEAADITARQIIAALLDVGWLPPSLEN